MLLVRIYSRNWNGTISAIKLPHVFRLTFKMDNEVQQVLVASFAIIMNEDTSSNSSDDSDYEEIRNILQQNVRIPKIHCKNYVEHVVNEYTDEDFKTHFR